MYVICTEYDLIIAVKVSYDSKNHQFWFHWPLPTSDPTSEEWAPINVTTVHSIQHGQLTVPHLSQNSSLPFTVQNMDMEK